MRDCREASSRSSGALCLGYGVPESLSAARLHAGNRLDRSVALNLLDAEPAVLVGSAYDVAFLDVCYGAVGKTDRGLKLPAHSRELEPQLKMIRNTIVAWWWWWVGGHKYDVKKKKILYLTVQVPFLSSLLQIPLLFPGSCQKTPSV